jgi:hypothetical protein
VGKLLGYALQTHQHSGEVQLHADVAGVTHAELHVSTADVSHAEIHVSTAGVSHAELRVSTAGVSHAELNTGAAGVLQVLRYLNDSVCSGGLTLLLNPNFGEFSHHTSYST